MGSKVTARLSACSSRGFLWNRQPVYFAWCTFMFNENSGEWLKIFRWVLNICIYKSRWSVSGHYLLQGEEFPKRGDVRVLAWVTFVLLWWGAWELHIAGQKQGAWAGTTAASELQVGRRRRNKQVCVDGQGNLRHTCLGLGLSPPQGHLLPFLEDRMGGSSPHTGTKVWLMLKHQRKPSREIWADAMLHVRLKQE